MKIGYASLLLLLFAAACKAPATCICQATASIPFSFNLQVNDKTSGKSLFFGTSPAYRFKQLQVFHLHNGVVDTIVDHADSVHSYFVVGVPVVHLTDTVTIKVASLTTDTLFLSSTRIGCCIEVSPTSIAYKGAIVYKSSAPAQPVVLAK